MLLFQLCLGEIVKIDLLCISKSPIDNSYLKLQVEMNQIEKSPLKPIESHYCSTWACMVAIDASSMK